jgi:hypothetical protein
MSVAVELEQASAELDAMVARQDFSGAQSVAGRIGELLRSGMTEKPSAEAAELIREGISTIEGARRKICAMRARMAERLRRLERTAHYAARPRPTAHTWSMEA